MSITRNAAHNIRQQYGEHGDAPPEVAPSPRDTTGRYGGETHVSRDGGRTWTRTNTPMPTIVAHAVIAGRTVECTGPATYDIDGIMVRMEQERETNE